MVDQSLAIRLHREEVVGLVNQLQIHSGMIGTATDLGKIAFLFELLAALAIFASVALLDDQPSIKQLLLGAGNFGLVPFARGAHVEVIIHTQHIEHALKLAGALVEIFLRRQAQLLSGFLVLLPMLITTGREQGLDPARLLVALEDVRHHRSVRMANMRGGIHIIDRCGQIAFHNASLSRHSREFCKRIARDTIDACKFRRLTKPPDIAN